MEAVKKNLLSIIFGVVALLAIVAGIAYPIPGMFDDLTAKLTSRKKDYDAINNLMKVKRPIPTVQVDSKDARLLEGFPNNQIIDWANGQITAVKDQGQRMLIQALDIDDRMAWHLPESQKTKPAKPGLLVNDPGPSGGRLLLPTPDDTAKGRFRDRYDETMRSFFVGTPKQGEKPGKPGTLIALLNAAIPPTADEIKDEMTRIEASWMARKQLMGNTVVNEKEIMEGMANEQAQVADRLKNEQAMGHMLYINTDKGLYYHPRMFELVQKRDLPTASEIWWAQIGYWIQSDIVKAIVDANTRVNAKSVNDSVVKHVIEVYVPDQYLLAAGPTGLSGGSPSMIRGPSGSGAAPTGDPLRVSPTGRVCNSLYDVVRFNFTVNVDEKHMGTFLAELSRDRLINIVEMDVSGVDRSAAQAAGYMYGDSPVVQLRLRCEALFMRGWTVPLMPREIKQLLGIETASNDR